MMLACFGGHALLVAQAIMLGSYGPPGRALLETTEVPDGAWQRLGLDDVSFTPFRVAKADIAP